ncbi:MAG TPA: prolipoprotein diacylglyceryl transferase [Candidatus Eisenbacteria bacterium]|nr:prolipoprotein diacylglyceryl transferase [Candidatus Eisenbacteria bacterium]
MHPTLFHIGSFQIHTYGLLLAIGFLIAIQIFVARGVRRGIPEDQLHTISLVILILAIVGGRGLFVLTHWSDYAKDWLGVFRLWEGGLMLYGGYILAIAGGIWYVRRAKLPVWRIGDAAAPAMALGIGIGRLGCYFNGCCFGLPTHLPWAVTFPPGSYASYAFPGEAIHPSQIYLALAGVFLFGLLLAMDRKHHFDGWLFWTAVAIDAVFRFGIDFTRYYDSTSYLGRLGPLSFNINQILSAILFITALVMLRVLSRRPAPSAAATGPEPGDETAASALGTQAG